ncbi:MAG: hypothetical protein KatS3mg050_1832 [Litorilinea sp.]|nr:MAG: hypothetical protein KatS3mg050_1832 [Litorilinea sp.]
MNERDELQRLQQLLQERRNRLAQLRIRRNAMLDSADTDPAELVAVENEMDAVERLLPNLEHQVKRAADALRRAQERARAEAERPAIIAERIAQLEEELQLLDAPGKVARLEAEIRRVRTQEASLLERIEALRAELARLEGRHEG